MSHSHSKHDNHLTPAWEKRSTPGLKLQLQKRMETCCSTTYEVFARSVTAEPRNDSAGVKSSAWMVTTSGLFLCAATNESLSMKFPNQLTAVVIQLIVCVLTISHKYVNGYCLCFMKSPTWRVTIATSQSYHSFCRILWCNCNLALKLF